MSLENFRMKSLSDKHAKAGESLKTKRKKIVKKSKVKKAVKKVVKAVKKVVAKKKKK